METDRAASHVEFFAKAVQRVEVRNGRYWVKQAGNALQSHLLYSYYFGHLSKCNFFLLSSIERHYFPVVARLERSCRASKTTRNISS